MRDPRRRWDFHDRYGQPLGNRPDRPQRGNVAFADGHVEAVTREYVWDEKHFGPLH